jgi:hypothetical protein
MRTAERAEMMVAYMRDNESIAEARTRLTILTRQQTELWLPDKSQPDS